MKTKKRWEAEVVANRKAARNKLHYKNRDIDQNESIPEPINMNTQDMLYPIQNLVLQDWEIASCLFYNLFECLFDNEPSQETKDAVAEEAIKILRESVSYESSAMSSILLVLLKICKTHQDIDIKAIERVGTKSLNFSKAILLLEELIISKQNNSGANKMRDTKYDADLERHKEWICLKRLHEASGMQPNYRFSYFLDSTGSQNLMVDEFLTIKENNGEMIMVREANFGEKWNQRDRLQVAREYLNQLEQTDRFDELWSILNA